MWVYPSPLSGNSSQSIPSLASRASFTKAFQSTIPRSGAVLERVVGFLDESGETHRKPQKVDDRPENRSDAFAGCARGLCILINQTSSAVCLRRSKYSREEETS